MYFKCAHPFFIIVFDFSFPIPTHVLGSATQDSNARFECHNQNVDATLEAIFVSSCEALTPGCQILNPSLASGIEAGTYSKV